jgi:hypothetical protein
VGFVVFMYLSFFTFLASTSRLLVRLAGLFTLAFTVVYLEKMLRITPVHRRGAALAKTTHGAARIVKKLGQGGPMKYFLNYVQPFTRALRLLVGSWRWVESAQCRRDEVGTEEAMVCVFV